MTVLDTTIEAAAVQAKIQCRLGPEARFRLAMEMSDVVFRLAETGIKFRHPEYTDRSVTEALIHALHGVDGQRS